jgi:hypothetical protein
VNTFRVEVLGRIYDAYFPSNTFNLCRDTSKNCCLIGVQISNPFLCFKFSRYSNKASGCCQVYIYRFQTEDKYLFCAAGMSHLSYNNNYTNKTQTSINTSSLKVLQLVALVFVPPRKFSLSACLFYC